MDIYNELSLICIMSCVVKCCHPKTILEIQISSPLIQNVEALCSIAALAGSKVM